MSYILDALQRSEQARRANVGAMGYSLLPPSGAEAPPQSWRRYALLAALLLLNAAVMYRQQVPAPPASVAARPLAAERHAAAPRAEYPVAPPPQAPAEPAPPPLRSRSGAAAAAPAAPAAAAPVKAATAAPGAGETVAPPPQRAPTAVAAADVPKTLPPLAVAGYIRDAGANDMVIVNDKLLRAGDEVEPGLKLEQILDDGAVFSFRGYRFKR